MALKLPDPTDDIYRLLDDAGLRSAALLATREPMTKIIESMRNEIARQFKDYLKRREAVLIKEKKNGKV